MKQTLFLACLFLLSACQPLDKNPSVLPETTTPNAESPSPAPILNTDPAPPTLSPMPSPTLISSVTSSTTTPTSIASLQPPELVQSLLVSNTIYPNGTEPQIAKFLVSYSPTDWEYFPAEQAYYSVYEPVLVNRKMPACTLTRLLGRGLPYWVTEESIQQELGEVEWQLRKDSLLRDTESGRVFTVSYWMPVASIELSVHGVPAGNDNDCINAAETVLRNFEIVYESGTP